MLEQLFFIAFFITIVLLIIIGIINTKVKKTYKSATKVSVIITCEDETSLNVILPFLLKYENIDDIHVVYRKKENYIEHPEERVRDVTSQDDYEQFAELFHFKQFSKVKHECILFLSGNVLLSERFLLKLLENYDMDIENLYGSSSKQCDRKGYKENRLITNTISLPIIMTSKKVVQHCWNTISENKVILGQLHESSTESAEVFLSYAFRKHFKKYPTTVKGRVYNLLKQKSIKDPMLVSNQCKTLSLK